MSARNSMMVGSKRSCAAWCAIFLVLAACGSDVPLSGANGSPADGSIATPSSSTENTALTNAPFISATLGEPVAGYQAPVDVAIRTTPTSAQNFIAEQGGLIREFSADGGPGNIVADLTARTQARGEQGLLGLAFDNDGARAFVNYTDLDGNTKVDQFDIDDDGTFVAESRQTIYSVDQPYRNHNGGDLMVMPDGRSLLVFNGDGGSADDPDRKALDPTSDLGKIIQVDISSTEPTSRLWARGLRNPWRASYDPMTGNLWIADVGQSMWEEINVVALDRAEGVSFGWSALEGTVSFNDDQKTLHQSLTTVDPIYTYPHENDDCSISGGFVYRGTEIAHLGSWYLFTDFCSGDVRALCVEENDTTGEISSCGVVSLGTVPNPVGIMPDASGRPWVLSLGGSIVPIVPAE